MKAKQLTTKVKELKRLKKDVYLLSLTSGYLARTSLPGNFLHIKIRDTILRRPFSIHKVSGNTIYVLFRVRGKGTAILARYRKGDTLDIIGPLGRGFKHTGRSPQILVAGGIGVAPLVFLAQKLKGTQRIVLLGAKTKKDVIAQGELKELGSQVFIATEDGSQGFKGTTVDLLREKLLAFNHNVTANIYACGPTEMFREIFSIAKDYPRIKCQVSFEQFMGCGLGICCGCTIETKLGYKKVCKDGPVFDLSDIW